jgi:protein TonB
MRWPLLASAALHGGLAAAWCAHPGGPVPDDVPMIEVELVQQAPMQVGAARSEPAAPEGQEGAGTATARPEAVNLGDGPFDMDPLSVTGENIIPATPDSAFHNRPPSYPPMAARMGAEGTVQLLVRVSAAGVPDEVRVAASSGYALLDRTARDAVLLWRFRPAQRSGRAMPFDYVMNIRFSLGER